MTECTSPEGFTEFANAVCHVIDFDEEGLSHALCNQVVTEETLGVVLTGSGTAEFDLTGSDPEDFSIAGTSEFIFSLPDVAGKIISVFDGE